MVWGEIVYRNVPFQVVDFSTGHEEADAKLEEMNFQCVLGSQLMMPLNEICFDFKNCEIIVPQQPSDQPAYAPNMYRSASNMFIVSLYDERTEKEMYALWDTGNVLSDPVTGDPVNILAPGLAEELYEYPIGATGLVRLSGHSFYLLLRSGALRSPEAGQHRERCAL